MVENSEKNHNLPSLKLTANAPKMGWKLKYYFDIAEAHFHMLFLVSGRKNDVPPTLPDA